MFLKFPSISTDIDSKLTAAFNLYKDDIIALHEKQWKQEDVSGASTVQYKIAQYYYAVLLAILIYTEYQDGIETDWDYYKTKYDIAENTKKFACNRIDFDAILAIFNLPPDSDTTLCGGGIGSEDVEQCLVVEENPVAASSYGTVDIADLLDNPSSCTNLVAESCS